MTQQHDNIKAAYLDYARARGVKHAVVITADALVFDHRAYLKCMYGCWGGNPETPCPSRAGGLKPWEYEPLLRRYQWGILLHAHDNRLVQRAALELEKRAAADGFYFAFSLSDCDLCETCGRPDGRPCAHPLAVRPAMHGVGIDVFRTVHNLGLPLRAVGSPDDELNCYALVLFE